MQDAEYLRVPIHQRGEIVDYALIDADDAERLGIYRWRLSQPHGYAQADIPRPGARPRREYMHRMVLNRQVGDGAQVDHINRNKLDNRRANLRIVGKTGNMQNMIRTNGKSRFRGVSPYLGRWRATVFAHGRQNHVGSFDSEMDAARAAEAFRLEHMPFAQPDLELAKALRPDPVAVVAGFVERTRTAERIVASLRDAGWLAD